MISFSNYVIKCIREKLEMTKKGIRNPSKLSYPEITCKILLNIFLVLSSTINLLHFVPKGRVLISPTNSN